MQKRRQLECHKHNLSKTWKTLRMIINKKKKINPKASTFDVNGSKVTNSVDIANHFNKYFLNSPIELCKKFSTPSKDPCEYLNRNITKSLYMGPSTEEDIMKILLNIKNSSPGHDDINIKVLKAVKDDIIAPLTHLCNTSLITGKVPNELKIAKVVPIHKKGKLKMKWGITDRFLFYQHSQKCMKD